MKRSFTIVEVLVAITVFALAMLMIFSVIIAGISINLKAKRKAIASYIAQKGMEEIRNTPFESLNSKEVDASGLPSGKEKWTFSPYENEPFDKIKKAEVRVEWSEGGTTKSVKYETLITNGGLNPQ